MPIEVGAVPCHSSVAEQMGYFSTKRGHRRILLFHYTCRWRWLFFKSSTMRLPTLLLLVASALLLAIAGAQPIVPCDTYGDCSCKAPTPFGTVGVNCSEGTWHVQGNFTASKNIDISTDRVEFEGDFIMPNNYNFTFSAVFNASGASGGYVHAKRVDFGASNYIFWTADAPAVGNYTYVLMNVDNYAGSSMPKQFVTPTVRQSVCRKVEFTVDSALIPIVRFNASVISTGQACPGSLPSNEWVLIVLYVVAGVLGAMIIFILLTCFVRPLKRRVWYPPKDV